MNFKDHITARILADSVSPEAVRMTTMEIEYPRFILAELNTHRMLSKNSASSRAIPVKAMHEQIKAAPAGPVGPIMLIPLGPVGPVSPCDPGGPPNAPVGPLSPVAPVDPV